jgi:hypothetical protein
MVLTLKVGLIVMAAPLVLAAQIDVAGVSTSTTQAILQYTSPVESACSLKVADMVRAITIVSGAQTSGQVTIRTSAPHGLLAGAVVYIENSDAAGWNGWQTVTSVPTPQSFLFANATAATATVGNVGVLVDDVNPALFAGADQDSRPGNVTTGSRGFGRSRTFVLGLRYAQFAADGNRHSRALQSNARHHYTLTCGSQSFDQEFQTQNIPLGDTHNDGPLADRNNPGQYAYPTIQWSNQNQVLIDPVSGIRSFRATAPQGAASSVQTFVTVIDRQSAWRNPSAPLTNRGGTTTFTGPCASGTCPLFLRADNLVIGGGATYTSAGSSLDWFTVTVTGASIGNSACVGDDCGIVACLTVNGQTCASGNEQASLSGAAANYTFGTQNSMDLWQESGAPGVSRVDASQAVGTVSYVSATKQVTVASGNPFNVRWTSGSTISIAGAQYTIASVQSELQLTLVSGPTGNLSAAAYSASNFGVLLWKKTATADRISIGYATYLYGSTAMPGWPAAAGNSCSPPVSAAGKLGYNCFVGYELYWVAEDGSDLRDLGNVAFSYGGASQGTGLCGGTFAYQFDPQDGNTWYCTAAVNFDFTLLSIFKAHYNGAQTRVTPGQNLPDCSLNSAAQPCLQFTNMQPNSSVNSIPHAAPLFNPDYAASGFQPVYWDFVGISPDGDLAIEAQGPSQDTPSWMFVYTLGDRAPMGMDANSLRLVAGASSYRRAPMSWCTIHDMLAPDSGWVEILSNDLTFNGPAGTYNMTLTSAPLNQNVGVPGGLNACPINPLGIMGQGCTDITVNGEPASALNGSFLQNLQVGDVMVLDNEYMRVLVVTSPTQLTVQRGYIFSVAASHTNTTFYMACGTRNIDNALYGLWNYRSDPYGANVNWATIINDPNGYGGHTYIGGGIPNPVATVTSGGATYVMGETLCPSAQGGTCDQVRLGYMSTVLQSPISAVETDPPFAGIVGIGQPNQVDSHPGLCLNGWCMDGRPLNNGTNLTLGANQPFTNVTGQLWKVNGAQSILNRKFLATIAYVGRAALVDVSGPGSSLGTGPSDSYKYCYAFTAGECEPDSASGGVYVNTPYVSYPFCNNPGIANQSDDTNAICIGDLGAYTGNLVQMGYTQHDVIGAGFRRLGPNYTRWSQQDVYWNADVTPSGSLMISQVRWLDGVRFEDLINVLPPYPATDGVSRNSFIPVPVTLDPPPGVRIQSAVVEFGYAENGGSGTYYCTSRQENCVATGGAVNQATPFYFEQSESYAGVPCSAGCTIAIPALSQRVLYYRWKYLNNLRQVIGASPASAMITP